jgi:hypothetical protein
MRSRTEGAPSLPIVSDDEELDEALRRGAISPDQHRAAVAGLPSSSPSGEAGPRSRYPGHMDMDDGPEGVSAWFRDFDADMARKREAKTADRRARFDREVADAERGLDEMRAGPGAPPPRVRPPSPTARLEQEGQDLADSRAYGRPSQGGAPFRSAGEAEEYGRRRVASPARRAEMAAQGMTDAQIIDAQRSQRDRDMAQSGISGSSGWAPVYVNGRVTYMERAPDGPVGLTQEIPPIEELPPVPEQRTTLSLLGSFPPRPASPPPAARPPAPAATRTVVNVDRGATNTASGNRRSGPLVDSGEFSDSLGVPGNITPPEPVGTDRTDLRRRGYEQRTMDGPYGPERVWVKTRLGDETQARLLLEGDKAGAAMTLEEYQAREKERSLKRRLMDRAGKTSKEATEMSVQQLRDLIADNRNASERDRKANNARARMAPRFRNELAFDELGGPNSNEWQNAVAAQRLAPDLRGMTPTMRDAMNMQRAFDLANAALRGGGAADAMELQQQLKKEADLREARKEAASYFNSPWRVGQTHAQRRAAAEQALQAKGTDPAVIEMILNEFPIVAPAPAAPLPDGASPI